MDSEIETPAPPLPGQLRARARALVDSDGFSRTVLAVILFNAVLLGLDADVRTHADFGGLITVFDALVTGVFVVEIGLKLFVYRTAFLRSGWNFFDMGVVLISLIPDAGAFLVLRVLRVFRVFRVFSVLPALRRVIDALLKAIPGMGAILAVLAVLFYVTAVMATTLFSGDARPQIDGMFGSVPESAFTLFQIMTLDGWSSEVVRVVMARHPWAWVFFIPFIVLTSFAVLNLFIAVIVQSLQEEHEQHLKERAAMEAAERDASHGAGPSTRQALPDELGQMLVQIQALRQEVAQLSRALGDNSAAARDSRGAIGVQNKSRAP